MTEWSILMAVVFIIVMILPIIRRVFIGSTSAKLKALKTMPESKKVLFILGGMMAPPAEKFRYLANDYNGDVIYIEYPHDGCGMDKYCLQIRLLVARGGYKKVDVLGISIGAEVFPTLVELLGRCVDLKLYGVCPAGPNLLHERICRKTQIAMMFLAFVKVILGIIGEIPLFYWSGTRRSLSEFVEQGAIAVWDQPFWHERYLLDGYPVWIPSTRCGVLFRSGQKCLMRKALKGFVLAEEDEFIDNERVEYTYFAVPVRYVPGKHARLDSAYLEYLEALRDLGLYDYD